MATRKKTTNTVAKPNRTGVPLNVYIDPQLRAVLDAYLAHAKPKISLTATVEDALQDYFQAKGMWPPKES